MIGSNEVVNKLIENEELVTMFGEILRFIRINPNSPDIMKNLNALQPCQPFYLNQEKFEDISKMSIKNMLPISVSNFWNF